MLKKNNRTYYLAQLPMGNSVVYPDDVVTTKPQGEALKCRASSRHQATNRFQALRNSQMKEATHDKPATTSD